MESNAITFKIKDEWDAETLFIIEEEEEEEELAFTTRIQEKMCGGNNQQLKITNNSR